MRIRLLATASALTFLASMSFSVFADPYQDLQTGADAFQNVLQQEIDELVQDQADLKLQSTDEFFPVSGSGSSSSRWGPDAASSPFVTFRIGDASYILTDVPVTAWFAPYVRDVADQGIVSGYKNADGTPSGLFGPERNVSIEELAKMAVLAARLSLGSCEDPPKNVAAQKSWSATYIRCAELRNFAVYADGSVDIQRPATRGEVVMTVLQAFGVPLRDSPPAGPALKDVTASTLFSSAIFTALQDGVVAGFSDAAGNLTGYFGPEKPVNRAEVSKIISLAVQLYGEQ